MAVQYKVLNLRTPRFSGKFNPEVLEHEINGYAKDGWVLKATMSADLFRHGLSTRAELFLIMEKAN